MEKSILVMGGSYFIGRKIVDILIEAGYTIFTLNRGTKPVHNSEINNIICDRNNIDDMRKVLKGYKFDIVIDVCGLNKKQVEILYNALELEDIKQFVFISSSAVYDVENCTIPYIETDKLEENKYWTFYGKNKIEAEKFLIEKFNDLKTNLTILRPPYIYGENNYAQRESFIFEHICNNKPIIIPNNGNTKLQFVYTTDLANIILKLLNTQLKSVNIFNVGNKKSISIKEWIECCERVAEKSANIIEYNYKEYRRNVRQFFPFFDYNNVLDVAKINRIYNIETDFIKGLEKSYLWYCENKDKITFKEDVTQNEKAILEQLNI